MLPTSQKVETMSRSASPSKVKFLLDENVDKALEKFLKSKGFDALYALKGLSNGKLAELSNSEKRVLVTNDEDFVNSELFPKDKIFSVIWLRIPQEEPEALLEAFSKLLDERDIFEGYFIILTKEKSEVFPLVSWKFKEYKSEK